ncbi:hypothetical protein WJX84_007672 [Apatococcus fuscideae]|uniref:Uncharacterized protein n=1 Tax=Apatococcus fuscideae TaxID=2026836 RepID=A0AAW1SPC2_9CHLO
MTVSGEASLTQENFVAERDTYCQNGSDKLTTRLTSKVERTSLVAANAIDPAYTPQTCARSQKTLRAWAEKSILVYLSACLGYHNESIRCLHREETREEGVAAVGPEQQPAASATSKSHLIVVLQRYRVPAWLDLSPWSSPLSG